MMKRVIFVGMFVIVVLAAGWWVRYQFSPPTGFGERYQVVVDWPQLPEGMAMGQVVGVDVDGKGGFTWPTGAMGGCRFLLPTAVAWTPGRIGAGWEGRGPFASGQMGLFLW